MIDIEANDISPMMVMCDITVKTLAYIRALLAGARMGAEKILMVAVAYERILKGEGYISAILYKVCIIIGCRLDITEKPGLIRVLTQGAFTSSATRF